APRQLGLGGHQLAAEGCREDRLRQLLRARRRRRYPPLDGVGEHEKRVDAADDLVRLGEGWEGHAQFLRVPRTSCQLQYLSRQELEPRLRTFRVPQPLFWRALRVLATQGPVTIRLHETLSGYMRQRNGNEEEESVIDPSRQPIAHTVGSPADFIVVED